MWKTHEQQFTAWLNQAAEDIKQLSNGVSALMPTTYQFHALNILKITPLTSISLDLYQEAITMFKFKRIRCNSKEQSKSLPTGNHRLI